MSLTQSRAPCLVVILNTFRVGSGRLCVGTCTIIVFVLVFDVPLRCLLPGSICERARG